MAEVKFLRKTWSIIAWSVSILSVFVILSLIVKDRYGISYFNSILGIESRRTSGNYMNVMADKKIKIVIDPGHGGFDAGTRGRTTKTKESELNLQVALLLKDELKTAGFIVELTRETEYAIADTKDEDMQKRRSIINNSSADIVLSIHMNYYQDFSVSGPICFFMPKSEKGELLAKMIQKSMNEELMPKVPKNVVGEQKFILQSGSMPCVLIECGFLSNYDEEMKLKDPFYQKRIARSVTWGIIDYFML